TGGWLGSDTSGVIQRTPPRSEVASPSDETCTSNRPPDRRYGEASAVTSTAATFREINASGGTTTLNRLSRFTIERTVGVSPANPPKLRSPVPSSPTTNP